MNENKRVILAAISSFALIFVYFEYIYPKLAPKPIPPAPAEAVATEPAAAAPASEPAREAPAQPAPEPTMRAAQTVEPTVVEEAEDYVVETPLFLATLTNRGAAIKQIRLRDFTTYPKSNEPLELISEIEPGKFSLVMSETRGLGSLDTALWEYIPDTTVPEGFIRAERFRITIPQKQLEITKTFLFKDATGETDGGRYITGGRDITVEIAVMNLGDGAEDFQYRLTSAAGIMPEPVVPPVAEPKLGASKDIAAVVGAIGSNGAADVESFTPKKAPRRVQGGLYAGVRNRYFAAVLRPRERADLVAVQVEKIGANNVTATLELGTLKLGPGETARREFTFLVVPRVPEVLKHYDGGQFEPLVEYGWPRPVTRALMWFLQAIYKAVPNYGLAIIILTVVVRTLLHPLTLKSQKTSHKMQRIQPLLTAAKEKYKHDKRVQQQEVMKIMKEGGANPLGGCLPMLFQLPIFIALWRALYQDVTLRHASFVLWIRDLSAPDNLATLGASLPILGRSVNLLPILCAVTMFFQQRMMPKNPDPQMQQQQKIMMFMPIIFTVMLYNMPSGLMLYFLSSTVFGLVEQKYILWRLNRAIASAPAVSIPVEKKKK